MLTAQQKLSRRQISDINESKMPNNVAVLQNFYATPSSSYIRALQDSGVPRLISDSDGCDNPQANSRGDQKECQYIKRERVIGNSIITQYFFVIGFIYMLIWGGIIAWTLRS
jgi:hypothetical protein